MKKQIICLVFAFCCGFIFAEEEYRIGDFGPGGGVIFYIVGNEYLECSELLAEVNWHDALLVTAQYEGGGYDDWYLPTKRELNYVYHNLRRRDRLTPENGWMWSSSEYSDMDAAWVQRFSDGEQDFVGEFDDFHGKAEYAYGVYAVRGGTF